MIRRLAVILTTLCAGIVVLASPAPRTISPAIIRSVVNTSTSNVILLRSQPSNKAPVIGQFQPQDNLVPFYQDGNWYKAGDPKTGQVGWFNINQYNTVVGKVTEPVVNQFSISVQQQANGPLKIIAYQNGKRLNQQQAFALYKQAQQQMQEQQQQWQKQMAAFQQQMVAFQQQITDLIQANQDLFNFPEINDSATVKPLPVATQLNPNIQIKALKQ